MGSVTVTKLNVGQTLFGWDKVGHIHSVNLSPVYRYMHVQAKHVCSRLVNEYNNGFLLSCGRLYGFLLSLLLRVCFRSVRPSAGSLRQPVQISAVVEDGTMNK